MLNLTNRKIKETFSYKYVILINSNKFEILSNLNENQVDNLLLEMAKQWEELKSYKVLDCIEFEYNNENYGITFDTLRNYL